MKKFGIYIRVSTQKQGLSGLGLEAQRETCINYINSVNGKLLQEFKDIESGTSRTRQGLFDALEFCKKNDCTLVIAKLDRLARDVEFTFKVINMGVDIYFCDMPQVNTMILGVFASVAQYERELISKRTKDGLAVRNKQLSEQGYFISKSGNKVTKLGGNGDTSAARAKSIESRHNSAKNNQSNKFLYNYITTYQNKFGKITANTSKEVFQEISSELNKLGQTTARGLEYNPLRLRAAWDKVKYMYNN